MRGKYMALIKCPECGKEIKSNKGISIKTSFSNTNIKNIRYNS